MVCESGDIIIVSSIPGPGIEDLDSVETGRAITKQYRILLFMEIRTFYSCKLKTVQTEISWRRLEAEQLKCDSNKDEDIRSNVNDINSLSQKFEWSKLTLFVATISFYRILCITDQLKFSKNKNNEKLKVQCVLDVTIALILPLCA